MTAHGKPSPDLVGDEIPLAVVEINVYRGDELVSEVVEIDNHHGHWTLWTLLERAVDKTEARLSVR